VGVEGGKGEVHEKHTNFSWQKGKEGARLKRIIGQRKGVQNPPPQRGNWLKKL